MYKIRRFGKFTDLPEFRYQYVHLKWYNLDTISSKAREAELRLLKCKLSDIYLEKAREMISIKLPT